MVFSTSLANRCCIWRFEHLLNRTRTGDPMLDLKILPALHARGLYALHYCLKVIAGFTYIPPMYWDFDSERKYDI